MEVKPPGEDMDFLLNLECIFELSHKSRDVRKGQVHKSESIDENTDAYETTLRITCAAFPVPRENRHGLVVSPSRRIPGQGMRLSRCFRLEQDCMTLGQSRCLNLRGYFKVARGGPSSMHPCALPCIHLLAACSACRREGFHLQLLNEMPEIDDIVGAEEARRKPLLAHLLELPAAACVTLNRSHP